MKVEINFYTEIFFFNEKLASATREKCEWNQALSLKENKGTNESFSSGFSSDALQSVRKRLPKSMHGKFYYYSINLLWYSHENL